MASKSSPLDVSILHFTLSVVSGVALATLQHLLDKRIMPLWRAGMRTWGGGGGYLYMFYVKCSSRKWSVYKQYPKYSSLCIIRALWSTWFPLCLRWVRVCVRRFNTHSQAGKGRRGLELYMLNKINKNRGWGCSITWNNGEGVDENSGTN